MTNDRSRVTYPHIGFRCEPGLANWMDEYCLGDLWRMGEPGVK